MSTTSVVMSPAWGRDLHRRRVAFLSLALCLFFGAVAQAGEKTDILLMANGDHITGELKSVLQGQLSFKTDDLGTLTVNWDRVASLVSKKTVELEVQGGMLYFGVLVEPSQEGKLAIQTSTGVEELPFNSVVRINPLAHGFFKGLDGSISVGGSYTKSSNVAQISIGGNVNRRRRKTRTQLSLSAISTTQEEGTTQNVNLSFEIARLLHRQWQAGVFAAYQRNQSLGIENRLLIGPFGGKQLVRTNSQELIILGGVDSNFEQTTAVEDPGQSSLEATLALSYNRFHYHHPKQNLSLSVAVFPNLTDSGRIRSSFNSDWQQEIISNFFFNLSLFGIYDNQPPAGALATTDYGIVTSIGYSFSP